MGENPVTPIHPGPNEKCSCNSGKKYKKCCGAPKGVDPPVPLTPEEEALLARRRSHSSSKVSTFLALAAMTGQMNGPMAPPPVEHGYPGQPKYGGGRGR